MGANKITSLDELKKLFENTTSVGEFFVEFCLGVRSWKEIYYSHELGKYFITNEIDDTEETYVGDDAFKKSDLYNYIVNGKLYFVGF